LSIHSYFFDYPSSVIFDDSLDEICPLSYYHPLDIEPLKQPKEKIITTTLSDFYAGFRLFIENSIRLHYYFSSKIGKNYAKPSLNH